MADAKRAAKKTEQSATALAAVIKTAPKLSAAKEARARLDEWLSEIAISASAEGFESRVHSIGSKQDYFNPRVMSFNLLQNIQPG